MAESNGDKSQEATPHRRQEAREQGQVVKSQDLASAVMLLIGLICLHMFGGSLIDYMGDLTRSQLGEAPELSAGPDFAIFEWNRHVMALARYVLPILGLLLLGGIVVNVGQVGFLFLPNKLSPDISRLDPLKGFQRIFSLANVVRLAFGLLKIALIAAVALVSLYQKRGEILNMTSMGVPEISLGMLQILYWMAIKVAIALVILAILDYGFQRWKFEQDIKMTPQEVREEMKNLEGNPQVIARRRQVQRQLAMSRLKDALPKADVVITNPTELAVAIRYEPETMAAPLVVAKGAGFMAERIRRLALEHGIPIVERKPLAQAIYKEVDVNRPIPADKYAAVAEVLAYVYQLQGKTIPAPPSD